MELRFGGTPYNSLNACLSHTESYQITSECVMKTLQYYIQYYITWLEGKLWHKIKMTLRKKKQAALVLYPVKSTDNIFIS